MMNKIFFVTLIILGFTSCSPYPLAKKSTVSFQLPQAKQNLATRQVKNMTSANTINSLDEINCYGITVGWNNNEGYCSGSTASKIFHANEIFGFYPAGSFVEIEVTAGDNRTFQIIGLASSNGICPDFIRFPLTQRSLVSSPQLVGSKTVKVPEGNMELTIDISMLGSQQITNCQNPPFLWEGGGQGKWDIARWDQATFAP